MSDETEVQTESLLIDRDIGPYVMRRFDINGITHRPGDEPTPEKRKMLGIPDSTVVVSLIVETDNKPLLVGLLQAAVEDFRKAERSDARMAAAPKGLQ